MSRLVVVVALLGACININPYVGPDAAIPPAPGTLGTIADVSVVLDGHGGATASGPGYLLHFADAVPHYPDSFMVAGMEVLAKGAPCERGSLMGIDLHPAIRSDNPGVGDQASLTIDIAGPSVARVSIDWKANLGGSCGTATVSSWFTFFPDGRITRYDTTTGSATTAATCTCDQSTDFAVTTEALYTSTVSSFLLGPTSPPSPSATGGDEVTDTTCMQTPSFNLFVADGPGPLPQLFPASNNNLAVAFRLNENNLTGQGMSTVIPLAPSQTCQHVLPLDFGYAYPPTWKVNTIGDNMNVFDGIAGGFSPYNSNFGVQTTSPATITLEPPSGTQAATTPIGGAFGLQFDSPYANYSVTKNGTPLSGDELRVQTFAGDATKVIVWLRDPMGQSDTLVVTGGP